MTSETVRTGGDVAVESLLALGAQDVVGLPGQHALGLFDALRRSPLRLLEARVENNAGFMADGLARIRGDVVPLLLSTGPGALTALPALMESAGSSIPVLALSSQVPVAGLGGGRRGFLHELRDQSEAFRQVVKGSFTVRSAGQIPSAIATAWQLAASAPQGPVLVEIPEDVLLGAVGAGLPPVGELEIEIGAPSPRVELLDEAARLLQGAVNPVVFVGGGAERSGAEPQVVELAERLSAPLVSTFSGRNAVPAAHPLHVGSWIEDIAVTEFLEDADVLLVVGSGLTDLSTNYFELSPRGTVIQIDADLGVFTSSTADVMLHADARLALEGLLERLSAQGTGERRAAAETAVAEVRRVVRERLDAQDLADELALLEAVRRATPAHTPTFWDMTILGYWAWSAWDRAEGHFASAQGSGGLGFAFPAAIGAAFGGVRTLAVSGDGGAMYGIAELVTAVQNRADVVWLIVDSGGYGILETYMTDAFGEASAVDLVTPDFVALAAACGVPAVAVGAEGLESALESAFEAPGPSVVVIEAAPRLFAVTQDQRTRPRTPR